jgi:hypothetical protein
MGGKMAAASIFVGMDERQKLPSRPPPARQFPPQNEKIIMR